MGVFVNPDEIENSIREAGTLNFGDFGISADGKRTLDFFQNSQFLETVNLSSSALKLRFAQNSLFFRNCQINSYFASVASDFIRQRLIEESQSFSFETVMSSPDKVEFLKKSKNNGYRNYLYFVATENPEINISRVEVRVKAGGHNVPIDKIESRYFRSMELLLEAIKQTDRAYIFDNSGEKAVLLAEITDGEKLEIRSSKIPSWFRQYVIDKIAMIS